MVSYAGYWVTAAFTNAIGLIGWVCEPKSQTFDTTRRWTQMWTWSGPEGYLKAFLNLLVAPGGENKKPYQLTVRREGPICRVSAMWYSDDLDGLLVRDPLTTTWSMVKNEGTISLLNAPKTRALFNGTTKNVLHRVVVASKVYQNAIMSQAANLAQYARAPRASATKIQNDVFSWFVVLDPETNARHADCPNDATGNATLWHAAQLYRLLCSGVTTAPYQWYVLRKTQIAFPSATFEGVQFGSNVGANYQKVNYAFSRQAMFENEPELNDQFASLMKVGTLPRYWWIKKPPQVDQTNDSRWIICQEFYGVEQFEPWIYPWVTGKSETIPSGVFNPALEAYTMTPVAGELFTADNIPSADLAKMPYGQNAGVSLGAKQWSATLQAAVFGDKQTYIDL